MRHTRPSNRKSAFIKLRFLVVGTLCLAGIFLAVTASASW